MAGSRQQQRSPAPSDPARRAEDGRRCADGGRCPNADLDALRAEMKLIEQKDPKTLTADERSGCVKAAGLEKVLEGGTFLGFLGKGAAEKVFDKVNKDMTDSLSKSPNASLADIKKHAETRFKSQPGSEVVAKSVVDMAMKQMKERIEERRDTFVNKESVITGPPTGGSSFTESMPPAGGPAGAGLDSTPLPFSPRG